MSRAVELVLGLMLLVIGLLVLASEPLGNWFSGLGISEEVLAWWPAIVVGAVGLLPGAGRVPRAESAAASRDGDPRRLPGGVGGALLYTSLNDRWDAWSYLWTVVPFSIGIGHVRRRLDRRSAGLQVDRLGDGGRGGDRLSRLRDGLRRRGVPADRRARDHRARAGADDRRARRAAQPEVPAA